MAHHNSTPDSVLNAPQRTQRWITQHVGMTRDERRHPLIALHRGGPQFGFDKSWRLLPVTNRPYVRPRGQVRR